MDYRLAVRLSKALTTARDAVFGAVRDATPWVWPPPIIVLCAWCEVAVGEKGRLLALTGLTLAAGTILAVNRHKRRK